MDRLAEETTESMLLLLSEYDAKKEETVKLVPQDEKPTALKSLSSSRGPSIPCPSQPSTTDVETDAGDDSAYLHKTILR